MSLILADLKFTKLFHKFELMLFDQGPFLYTNSFLRPQSLKLYLSL